MLPPAVSTTSLQEIRRQAGRRPRTICWLRRYREVGGRWLPRQPHLHPCPHRRGPCRRRGGGRPRRRHREPRHLLLQAEAHCTWIPTCHHVSMPRQRHIQKPCLSQGPPWRRHSRQRQPPGTRRSRRHLRQERHQGPPWLCCPRNLARSHLRLCPRMCRRRQQQVRYLQGCRSGAWHKLACLERCDTRPYRNLVGVNKDAGSIRGVGTYAFGCAVCARRCLRHCV